MPNRIDILTEIDGRSYDQVGSGMLNVDELSVPVMDLELLNETDSPES